MFLKQQESVRGLVKVKGRLCWKDAERNGGRNKIWAPVCPVGQGEKTQADTTCSVGDFGFVEVIHPGFMCV